MTVPSPVTCLVVDDEAPLRQILVRLLKTQGHVCREAGSGREAIELLEKEPADLVLSDIHMPEMDGAQLLAEIRKRWPDTGVVMITAVIRGSRSCSSRAFRRSPTRWRPRTRTRGGTRRGCQLTLRRSRRRWGSTELVAEVKLGGELHDIGKIGVRESVLLKPSRLTHDEYLHIMEHPVIGERILAPLVRDHSRVLEIVRSRHERPDGLGFPDRLAAGAIPLVARIAAVADTFDAMTTARPYRTPRPADEAIAELRDCSGRQFDGEAVAAFLRSYPDPAQLPIQTPLKVGALHEEALAALAR